MPQQPAPQPAVPRPVSSDQDAQPENVRRGVAVALLALPAGIILWDIIWEIGVVASVVAFLIAWGSMRLYRLGSNGPFSRRGAIAVLAITVVTLALALLSGFMLDTLPNGAASIGMLGDAIPDPRYWQLVFANMTAPSQVPWLLLAIAFGALGCVRVLMVAFRSTRPTAAQPAVGTLTQPAAPQPAAPQPAPRLTQDDEEPRA